MDDTPPSAPANESPDDNAEKTELVFSVCQVILWPVFLFLVWKFGHWFGGRWYHWILALFVAGIVKEILAKIVAVCVKGGMDAMKK